MWSPLELWKRSIVQTRRKRRKGHENLYRFLRFKGWQSPLVLLYLWYMNFKCTFYNFFGV